MSELEDRYPQETPEENLGLADTEYDVETQTVSMSRAAVMLGVSTKTLRNWDEKGKISVIRTPGGHRRIPLREINRHRSGDHVPEEKDTIMSTATEEVAAPAELTPNEYQDFLETFGLGSLSFLKPEKADLKLLPEAGGPGALNRDQVNFMSRSIAHKVEDILGTRLTDSEYQKIFNILATVHSRSMKDVPVETRIKSSGICAKPPCAGQPKKGSLGYLKG